MLMEIDVGDCFILVAVVVGHLIVIGHVKDDVSLVGSVLDVELQPQLVDDLVLPGAVLQDSSAVPFQCYFFIPNPAELLLQPIIILTRLIAKLMNPRPLPL